MCFELQIVKQDRDSFRIDLESESIKFPWIKLTEDGKRVELVSID